MTNIFLISEQIVKDYSPLLQNVDGKYISTGIRVAQDSYIESTLGTDLYKKLQDLIASGEIELSGNTKYQTLLFDFVMDPLIHLAVYNIIIDISYKLGNVNVLSMNAENSNPATLNEIKFIQQKWLDRGEFYLERLKRYLCDKRALYPELDQNFDSWKTRPSQGSAFFQNIYIKKNNRLFNDDDAWKYVKGSGNQNNGGH